MYKSSYGYGVYKRNQVNIGNPYQIKPPSSKSDFDEETFNEDESVNDFDKELLISQDIIHKAKEEAALIKREAELEAERMLSEAQEKANGIFEDIEQKAKEEGYRYGESLAQQHYNDLLAEAQEFRDRSRSDYEETLASLESEIVNLALNIAAKIVGEEIRSNEAAILSIARQTIASCCNPDRVILKVSSDDYDYVVENEEKLRSMVKDLNELQIRRDATLDKGSCVIDTGFGQVDGSPDIRLENIKQAFFEILQDDTSD